jgi:hypothetical protein
VTVLAAAPASGTVVTGVLGFLVVAALGVALFFLLRSMNKQLRKVMPPEPKWRANAPGPAGGSPASGSRREHQPVGEQDRPGPG